jgi:hypothetical protein
MGFFIAGAAITAVFPNKNARMTLIAKILYLFMLFPPLRMVHLFSGPVHKKGSNRHEDIIIHLSIQFSWVLAARQARLNQ